MRRATPFKHCLIACVSLLTISTATAQTSNALIFIRPEAVGRAIKPEAYDHGLWIQWPRPSTQLGTNRLLSIITGVDWWLSDDPLISSPDNTQPNIQALRQLGVLQARREYIGYSQSANLLDAHGNLPRDLTLAGINASGNIVTLKFGEPIPPGTLVIYGASTWEDAATVSKQVDGKSVIISYPPPLDSTLSAAWILGTQDVPVMPSTKVPGLVPARDLVRLLQQAKDYVWRPPTGDTPQQWAKTIIDTRPTQLISLFCFIFIIVVLALRNVAAESNGRLACIGIGMIPVAFIALYLSGSFAKASGLMSWNILPFFAYFALLLGLLPAYLAMRALWSKTHPLYPIVLCAAIILLWASPLYSVFSNVFSLSPLPISPIALGALASALTTTAALSFKGEFWPRILTATLFCVCMLLGVFTKQWWAPTPALLAIPILTLLAGAGAMRLYLLPMFVVWPFLFHGWNGHFAWDIDWLYTSYEDRNAINAAAQLQFLLSPLWLCTLASTTIVALAGGKFLKHQLRRAYALTNNARALFWAALALGCMGLREPYLLDSALVVLISGFLLLLFDSAGTL